MQTSRVKEEGKKLVSAKIEQFKTNSNLRISAQEGFGEAQFTQGLC